MPLLVIVQAVRSQFLLLSPAKSVDREIAESFPKAGAGSSFLSSVQAAKPRPKARNKNAFKKEDLRFFIAALSMLRVKFSYDPNLRYFSVTFKIPGKAARLKDKNGRK